MKRAVAYCRVSTQGQVGEDKYGIEAQKRDIISYCEKNNIQIDGWYIDAGVSGAKADRPELQRILNGDITNPPVEAVVVAKTDRLSREISQYYYFKFAFRRMNIELISVNEDFGTAGDFAPIYEAMVAAFAQMEREMITNRMSGGRRVKAIKGGYAGGKAPYGYTSSNGALVVNPAEAAIVREIFRLSDEGKTLVAISSQLAADGRLNREGKSFSPSTIAYIVKNRKTYEGYYKYGKGDWVKGQHEPILQ